MPPDSYSKEANNQHCIQADNSLKDLLLQTMIVLVQLNFVKLYFQYSQATTETQHPLHKKQRKKK